MTRSWYRCREIRRKNQTRGGQQPGLPNRMKRWQTYPYPDEKLTTKRPTLNHHGQSTDQHRSHKCWEIIRPVGKTSSQPRHPPKAQALTTLNLPKVQDPRSPRSIQTTHTKVAPAYQSEPVNCARSAASETGNKYRVASLNVERWILDPGGWIPDIEASCKVGYWGARMLSVRVGRELFSISKRRRAETAFCRV